MREASSVLRLQASALYANRAVPSLRVQASPLYGDSLRAEVRLQASAGAGLLPDTLLRSVLRPRSSLLPLRFVVRCVLAVTTLWTMFAGEN